MLQGYGWGVPKLMFMGPSLTFMMVYIWSRRNPDVRMSFLGLFNFDAPFLAWVILGFGTFRLLSCLSRFRVFKSHRKQRVCVGKAQTVAIAGFFGFLLLFSVTLLTAGLLRCAFLSSIVADLSSSSGSSLSSSFIGLDRAGWILGQNPVPDLLGIAVGHVYFFLDSVLPGNGGPHLLATPALLQRIFAEAPRPQDFGGNGQRLH